MKTSIGNLSKTNLKVEKVNKNKTENIIACMDG